MMTIIGVGKRDIFSNCTVGLCYSRGTEGTRGNRDPMNIQELLDYLYEEADELRQTIADTDGKYQSDYLNGCLDETQSIIELLTREVK
jgi:hypothetical protein